MIAALLAIAGLVYLAWMHQQNQKVAREQRATFLDDCRGLLGAERVQYDRFGYPVLTGNWRGLPVTAEAIIDTMAVRKLPVLWLRITVLAPLPFTSRTDVMMRPIGTEFYSTHHELDHRINTPAGWPEAAIIRADQPVANEFLRWIRPHLGLLREDDAKELFAGPNGLRLVWRIDEGNRSDFALLRQARFNVNQVDRAEFRRLLDWCAGLTQDVRTAAGDPATQDQIQVDAA